MATETATVHTVADAVVNLLQHHAIDIADREAIAYHDVNGARISLELTNGQRFYLSIFEDDAE